MRYILLILIWCFCNSISAQEKIIYKGKNHLLVIEGNCMIVYNLILDIFDGETELTLKGYKRRYRKTINKNKFLTRLSPLEIANELGFKTQYKQLFSYEQIDSTYQQSMKEYQGLEGFQILDIIIFDTVHIDKNDESYSIQFHNGLDWLSDFFMVDFRFKHRKITDLKVD